MNSNTQISNRPKANSAKASNVKTAITVSYGDGISPEIMEATLAFWMPPGPSSTLTLLRSVRKSIFQA